MLIGCLLRRGEMLALTPNSIQLREGHWAVADLMGKGGHIRTVPIPIQFLLGHVSIQTTERYLGCKQKPRSAVNDRLGIEPESGS
jgi:integrase